MGTLESSKADFLLFEGDEGLGIGIWRWGNGFGWICGCRWCIAGALTRNFRLRVHGGWRGSVVVVEKARIGHFINHGSWVCCSNPCCQRSCMAALPYWQAIYIPTTIYGDNQSAITLTHGGQYHICTKHIDIWYHFIYYIIKARSIKLIYCPMDEQMADILTKALPSTEVKHFANAIGLHAVWGGVLRMQMCMPNYRQYK